MRIIIADDNYLVREGTRRLLEDSGEVEIVAAVSSAAELVTQVRPVQPDAVLTDIRMPADDQAGTDLPADGIEAAHLIKSEYPSIGVVGLSQSADETYAFEMLKRGAAGLAYLLKDRVGDLDRLLHALHEVVHGGSVVDPLVVEALVARRARIEESALAELTPRELDVLRQMAQGKANAAIASRCPDLPSESMQIQSSRNSACPTRSSSIAEGPPC